jgi:Flp pilus assembly protein TadD
LTALAVVLATVAVYLDVRHHEFVNYDDPYYVTENAQVLKGLSASGIGWAFRTFEDGNWFPLTWISHMADVSLWGLTPGGHHLANVALHALAAMLLFLFFRALSLSVVASAAGALLFALHPLRVESVAWIAERKDVLCGALSVLTLWLYVRYAKQPRAGRYAAVMAAFACALMAKAMPVTLPLVMLILDDWPLDRRQTLSWGSLVREKTPFLLMSLAAAITAIVAQSGAGATASLTYVPLTTRLANAAVSYGMYLANTIWPIGLSVFYPRPTETPLWQLGSSVAAMTLVSWLAWRWRSRYQYVFTGWVWYLVMLVPVIGLVQVGAQARADRYTYLPSIGLCLVAAYGLADLERRAARYRGFVLGAAAAVAIAFASVSVTQLGLWQNSVTLFEHARAVTHPNYTVLNNLGEALAQRGDMARAAEVFASAVEVAPANAAARLNLANALSRVGRVDQAASEYRVAIRLQPSNAAAHAGLGAALGRLGQPEEAVSELRQALRLDPAQPDSHYNLGNLLAGLGRFDDAVESLAMAVRLRPGDAMARSNLGAAFASLGRFDEAIVQFSEALRIDPNLTQVQVNRERALQMKSK